MKPTIAAATATEATLDRGGRASWGAIFAGTVIGLAAFILLSLLGLWWGFAALEPTEANPIGAVPSVAPWWIVVSQILALLAGGYAAGRFAGVLHKTGSMLHGAAVWGLTTLGAVWLGVSASMSLVNMTGSLLTSTAKNVADAAQAVIPEDMQLPDFALPDVGMEALPQDLRQTLNAPGLTPQNFQAEAREIFRQVIDQAEQRRALDAVQGTAQEIIQQPSTAPGEIDDLVGTLFGQGGVLNEEDRAEALSVLQNRFSISQAEAEQFIDQVQAQLQDTVDAAQSALEEARQTAAQAMDAAVDAAGNAAMAAFIASLLGLVAAVAGAAFGRPVRD
ncbi:hypothetical protein O4G76_07060 [Limimaricola sp. G21655-S1]|uniref:hypothetical protein n=1 Tax=Limimaricola sp. G21655-S1 TaxID=3014768 RepID=UPI0022AF6E43|nr:hypothetical protein [Limimaricola sp. G21655-S1]MCZ4260599.1 hypothetical protein [Limimaricola sp. G21655-S1]